ncbi:MAG: transposase [Burkholderiaceae bacterium]|nr:transposase [Burkholderiaceae bacterium]
MARPPRLALAGELHYLLQRGHNHHDVFADDGDREAYLTMLRDAAAQYGVAIHAYALLPSEVHLLATPAHGESLSRLMQSLGRRYVAAYNRRHGRSGALWAGRFCAGLIDGAAFGADAVVHIEALPVRIGLAMFEADWPWSSAAHHLGRRRDLLITEHPAYWALGNTPFERELAHAHRLREGVPEAMAAAFASTAIRGRALGPTVFSARIAAQSGLNLQAKARGRPARGGGSKT